MTIHCLTAVEVLWAGIEIGVYKKLNFDGDGVLSVVEDPVDPTEVTITISVDATGSVVEIRYIVGTSATQDSTHVIPANARIIVAQFIPTTPYTAGATVAIGRAGSTSLAQATTDNDPQSAAADIFNVNQDTAWGAAALPVRTTVGGAPVAGAGVVIVRYAVPQN